MIHIRMELQGNPNVCTSEENFEARQSIFQGQNNKENLKEIYILMYFYTLLFQGLKIKPK